MKTAKVFGTAVAVAFAIYLFFAMIANIDFKGMSFSEIKLVLSVCLGVAVSVLSAAKGVQIIQSALVGFVTGAVLFALIEWAFQNLQLICKRGSPHATGRACIT